MVPGADEDDALAVLEVELLLLPFSWDEETGFSELVRRSRSEVDGPRRKGDGEAGDFEGRMCG